MTNRVITGLGALTATVLTTTCALAQCELSWAGKFTPPGLGDSVHAMAVFDPNDGSGPALFVGGEFTTAGGMSVGHIARWDGSRWSALDVGLNGTVWALAVHDDGSGPALYAGGEFTTAGGQPAKYIARWNGSAWSALGGDNAELSGVYALAVHADAAGSALYVGGWFTDADSTVAGRVLKWGGGTWSPLGTQMDNAVLALASFDDDGAGPNQPALYAGGYFSKAGVTPLNHIAKWNGASWSPLGTTQNGTDHYVYALAAFDDGSGQALYVGGQFTSAGGNGASHVAKWSNEIWSPLADGLNEAVGALGVFNHELYAGGWFTATGGSVPASHIARWDGSAWTAVSAGLGGGSSPSVQALAVYPVEGTGPDTPELYAGGDFFAADAVGANRLAKWNGLRWSSLGQGLDNPVSALTTFDPDADGPNPPVLCAGGYFTAAGGVAMSHVAEWDGSSWSTLGSGLNGEVRALVADDGILYAAGGFTSVAESSLSYIAQWKGSTWLPLSTGLNGEVWALAVLNGVLFAGGDFTTAGGATANYIATWDGTAWAALGAGMNAPVWTLTVHDGALYAGGQFSQAGGIDANHVAVWDGLNWSSLGDGTNDDVWALAMFDSDGGGPEPAALYAGGEFTQAGGNITNYITKWNGSTWTALGDGVGGPADAGVYALVVHDAGDGAALYVGGNFTNAGGQAAEGIASWDGASWSALGTGLNGKVSALHSFDDSSGADLYAGGWFTAAGGTPSYFLAEWFAVPPRITAWLPSPPVCLGEKATFEVVASGTGELAYQWRKDQQPIVGETNPTLVREPVTQYDSGVYDVVVRDHHCGHVMSAGATLTIASCICQGDCNCDGVIDFGDINPFVLYLSNSSAWQVTYADCPLLNGDINGDGTYGQLSFGDINPFVMLLSSTMLPIPCP